jgi:hypothetical protein
MNYCIKQINHQQGHQRSQKIYGHLTLQLQALLTLRAADSLGETDQRRADAKESHHQAQHRQLQQHRVTPSIQSH